MLDLFLLGFVLAFLGAGVRRPFLFVLAYAYIDVVAPQKVAWGFLTQMPVSLIAFIGAVGTWLFVDDKRGTRLAWRQALIVVLLVYCFLTTQTAEYADAALTKWAWVWKALVFAAFLPLTLRTRLRMEALALVMVLSVAVIVIGGGIKTLVSGGGGYGELKLLVNDNTGLYEGSIISMVAIAVIPVALWLARHGTIFPRSKLVTAFTAALCFACLLIPIGTQARTGLLCIGLLAAMILRTVKHRLAYLAALAAVLAVAVPMLPDSYTKRMNTIENHEADKSASTRVAVWAWTWEYAKDHPFGGGFMAFLGNHLTFEVKKVEKSGANTTAVTTSQDSDKARAYHSSYFEMLGEQGYPGLALWLVLQVSGLWQMERVRARWKRRARLAAKADPDAPAREDEAWIAPLADALFQAQAIYMLGSFFVGIAYQPFLYMLIGLQIALHGYAARLEAARRPAPARPMPRRKAAPPVEAPA